VEYPAPSRSNAFVRDAIIIAAFAYPVVIQRFISRIFIAGKLWWDDYFIMLAVVDHPYSN
jgi:hypothetical protein